MRLARGISVTNTSKPISTAIAYDADATAFFTAASITDTTQKNAVNTLVLSLKSANIWTKMKAIYPVVGGVSSSHAVNLKQPGTFNLSFATGWTHSSTGMTPNGATYADTFLTPSTALNTMSQHISYYSRTNSATVGIGDNGCQDDVSPSIGRNIYAAYYDTSTLSRVQVQSLDANAVTFTETNSLGFILGSRTSATSLKAYRNNILKGTNTTNSSSGLCGNSVYIGGFNYRTNLGSTIFYGIRQCAFASIGDGLTDAEASNFYTAVNTYQTTLGRNV